MCSQVPSVANVPSAWCVRTRRTSSPKALWAPSQLTVSGEFMCVRQAGTQSPRRLFGQHPCMSCCIIHTQEMFVRFLCIWEVPMHPDKRFVNISISEAPRKNKATWVGKRQREILNDVKLEDVLYIPKSKSKGENIELPSWKQAETKGPNFISKW